MKPDSAVLLLRLGDGRQDPIVWHLNDRGLPLCGCLDWQPDPVIRYAAAALVELEHLPRFKPCDDCLRTEGLRD